MWKAVAAVAFSLVVAGCAQPAPPLVPSSDGTTAEPSPPAPLVFHGRGTIGLALPDNWGAPGQGVVGNNLTFNAPANATALLVEVAWNDTTQDLDAVAHYAIQCDGGDEVGFAPCYAGSLASVWTEGPDGYYRNWEGRRGAPDNPSRIALGFPEDLPFPCISKEGCPWGAGIRLKEPASDLEFQVFATVFFDGPVPPGYSAIPW